MTSTVLVTGGTGYIARWCIVELLRRGTTSAPRCATRPRRRRCGPRWPARATPTGGWLRGRRPHRRRRLGRGRRRVRPRAPRRLAAGLRQPGRPGRPGRGGPRRRACACSGPPSPACRRVVMTSAANAASPSSYAEEGVTDETLWTDPTRPACRPTAIQDPRRAGGRRARAAPARATEVHHDPARRRVRSDPGR